MPPMWSSLQASHLKYLVLVLFNTCVLHAKPHNSDYSRDRWMQSSPP